MNGIRPVLRLQAECGMICAHRDPPGADDVVKMISGVKLDARFRREHFHDSPALGVARTRA